MHSLYPRSKFTAISLRGYSSSSTIIHRYRFSLCHCSSSKINCCRCVRGSVWTAGGGGSTATAALRITVAASTGDGSTTAAHVQGESMAIAAEIDEIKAKEFDEKMKSKYGQWVKTDFKGWDELKHTPRGYFSFFFITFRVIVQPQTLV